MNHRWACKSNKMKYLVIHYHLAKHLKSFSYNMETYIETTKFENNANGVLAFIAMTDSQPKEQ